MDGVASVVEGLRQGGIGLVASVPDINLDQLLRRLDDTPELRHTPVSREEEGIGVCAGSYLAGRPAAMLMQNGGLLNSCNALVTTALQFEIPMLLLVWYGGDLGDRFFMRLGEATEPVLAALGIRCFVLRDPERVTKTIAAAAHLAKAAERPVACLLTRDVLGSYR